jgi:hypothetical protein
MPRVKVIYLLRNPVERSWSYAAQYFSSPRRKGRYGGAENAPEDVLKAFLAEDARGHSDYLGALGSWQGRFPDSQMMVAYFDELESDPRDLFSRVLKFLEIDTVPSVIPPSIGENRRASRGAKAPMAYRVYLARLHLEQLKALDDRLGSEWTRRWLQEARELAGQGQPPIIEPVT